MAQPVERIGHILQHQRFKIEQIIVFFASGRCLGDQARCGAIRYDAGASAKGGNHSVPT
jgi:hypothetical protein